MAGAPDPDCASEPRRDTTPLDDHECWRDAVIYQIYPRSFADANGDGIGDLPGIFSHLDDLADLGIDAMWLSPFYPSPQKDAGYDVADYCDVDPHVGTLDDFDTLLAGAHDRGLRVIVDMVPNHSSDQHVWFQKALASPAGSAARARCLFRDGKGEHGESAGNDPEADGRALPARSLPEEVPTGLIRGERR